jgi:hypothetical protein
MGYNAFSFPTPANCRGLRDLKEYEITVEFSSKSQCLHRVFGPPFTPYPLKWDPQSNEILLNLGMKC